MGAADERPRRWWQAVYWRPLIVTTLVCGVMLCDRPEPETIPDPRRTVPDEVNTYAALLRLSAAALQGPPQRGPDGSERRYPDPQPDRAPWVTEWLHDHGAVLAAIDAALPLPECRQQPATPGVRAWATGHPGIVAPLAQIARVKVQRGHRRRVDGDLARALADYLDMVRLGARAARGGDHQGGRVCEAAALRGLRDALGPAPPGALAQGADPTRFWPAAGWSVESRQRWRDVIQVLLDWDEEPAAWLNEVAGRYHQLRELVADPHQLCALRPGAPLTAAAEWDEDDAALFRWLPPVPPLYCRHRTTNRLRRAATRSMARTQRPYGAVREPPEVSPTGLRQLLNPVGHGLGSRVADCFEVNDEPHARCLMVRATAVHIALKLFVEDHQRLPGTLAELVTGHYLPAVPLDPFDGQPLRYLPRHGAVYSVGSNRRDDGGRHPDDAGWEDDRVIRLTFVVPPAPPPGGPPPPVPPGGPPAGPGAPATAP